MQTLFDDPDYLQRLDAEAAFDPADGPKLGLLEQTGLGIMRGGAEAARTLGVLGGALAVPFGEEAADDYFEAVDHTLNDAVDYWTPDVRTTTTAGQIVGGLAEAALPLMVGAGNPAALMATMATRTTMRLVDQGVDASAAVPTGMVDALATGIGFKVPAIGKTLAGSIGLGVTTNPAIGAAGEGAQRAMLKAFGYDEQAQQFDPWRLESRAVEALLGGMFGTVGFKLAKADADALLAHRNAGHMASKAPGIPDNLRSARLHDDALRESIRAATEGREPALHIEEATFTRPAELDTGLSAAARELATLEAERLADLNRYESALPKRRRAEARVARADVAQAERTLDARPDLTITDADGMPVRAEDAMMRADLELEEARVSLPKAIDAAVTCLLGRA